MTCVYVAAKVVHYVPSRQMLATIISHAMDIPFQQVEQPHTEALELDVLEALEWRLSPYLRTVNQDCDVDSSANIAGLLKRYAEVRKSQTPPAGSQ